MEWNGNFWKIKIFLCLCGLTGCSSSGGNVMSPLPGKVSKNVLRIRGRIVGGKSTNIERHPFQVGIRLFEIFRFEHKCGGMIYSERLILTAAHCVYGRYPEDVLVAAGSDYSDGISGYIVNVERMIRHEEYDPETEENDIALLILSKQLPLNNRTTRAIPLSRRVPKVGEMVTVTGWGVPYFGGGVSMTLEEVQVPVVSNEVCKRSYMHIGRNITDSVICAGFYNIGGKDACQADSGGPLVFNYEAVGIVSWGEGCAESLFPGVYSSIPYFYPWIEEKLSEIEK